jgi:hypothetical protein
MARHFTDSANNNNNTFILECLPTAVAYYGKILTIKLKINTNNNNNNNNNSI